MGDSGLDAFAEEPTAATPDTIRNPRDTAVKVVFTDEQLASPLDVFAEEQQQGRYEISADPLDSPLVDVEVDRWLDPAASTVGSPAGPVLQPQRTRHVPLVLAAIVLLFAVLYVGGRSVVGEFGAAPRAVTSATKSAPAAFSEKTTALPTLAATVDDTPIAPDEPPVAQADEPHAAVDQHPRAERLTATKRRRGDVVRRPPARRALTQSRPVPLTASSATATQRRPETEQGLETTSGAPAPAVSTPLVTAPTPTAAAEAPRAPARATAPPNPSNPTAPLESSLPPVTRAVLRTLYQYQQALSALDSSAAQAVWPSVNVKALDKAFDQLGEQAIDLQGCDVGVSGARAEATCTGTASYVPKVGNKRPRLEERQWRFTLRQDDDRWLIERVDVRQASGGPNPIADR